MGYHSDLDIELQDQEMANDPDHEDNLTPDELVERALERDERYDQRLAARKDPGNIPFLDFETTGLMTDPNTVVLEGAVIITDGDLNELATFGPVAIHASEEEIAAANPWALEMHTSTGLLDRVRASTITREAFDAMLADFLAPYFPAKGETLPDGTEYRGPAIGGNSVKFDYQVIEAFFPRTLALVDYRVIDISSVGQLVHRWNPAAYAAMPEKASDHTAMTDIREGVKELRYYRSVGLG